jgi:hypothetical protein
VEADVRLQCGAERQEREEQEPRRIEHLELERAEQWGAEPLVRIPKGDLARAQPLLDVQEPREEVGVEIDAEHIPLGGGRTFGT